MSVAGGEHPPRPEAKVDSEATELDVTTHDTEIIDRLETAEGPEAATTVEEQLTKAQELGYLVFQDSAEGAESGSRELVPAPGYEDEGSAILQVSSEALERGRAGQTETDTATGEPGLHDVIRKLQVRETATEQLNATEQHAQETRAAAARAKLESAIDDKFPVGKAASSEAPKPGLDEAKIEAIREAGREKRRARQAARVAEQAQPAAPTKPGARGAEAKAVPADPEQDRRSEHRRAQAAQRRADDAQTPEAARYEAETKGREQREAEPPTAQELRAEAIQLRHALDMQTQRIHQEGHIKPVALEDARTKAAVLAGKVENAKFSPEEFKAIRDTLVGAPNLQPGIRETLEEKAPLTANELIEEAKSLRILRQARTLPDAGDNVNQAAAKVAEQLISELQVKLAFADLPREDFEQVREALGGAQGVIPGEIRDVLDIRAPVDTRPAPQVRPTSAPVPTPPSPQPEASVSQAPRPANAPPRVSPEVTQRVQDIRRRSSTPEDVGRQEASAIQQGLIEWREVPGRAGGTEQRLVPVVGRETDGQAVINALDRAESRITEDTRKQAQAARASQAPPAGPTATGPEAAGSKPQTDPEVAWRTNEARYRAATPHDIQDLRQWALTEGGIIAYEADRQGHVRLVPVPGREVEGREFLAAMSAGNRRISQAGPAPRSRGPQPSPAVRPPAPPVRPPGDSSPEATERARRRNLQRRLETPAQQQLNDRFEAIETAADDVQLMAQTQEAIKEGYIRIVEVPNEDGSMRQMAVPVEGRELVGQQILATINRRSRSLTNVDATDRYYAEREHNQREESIAWQANAARRQQPRVADGESPLRESNPDFAQHDALNMDKSARLQYEARRESQDQIQRQIRDFRNQIADREAEYQDAIGVMGHHDANVGRQLRAERDHDVKELRDRRDTQVGELQTQRRSNVESIKDREDQAAGKLAQDVAKALRAARQGQTTVTSLNFPERGAFTDPAVQREFADQAWMEGRALGAEVFAYKRHNRGGLFRRGPRIVEEYFRVPGHANMEIVRRSNRRTGQLISQQILTSTERLHGTREAERKTPKDVNLLIEDAREADLGRLKGKTSLRDKVGLLNLGDIAAARLQNERSMIEGATDRFIANGTGPGFISKEQAWTRFDDERAMTHQAAGYEREARNIQLMGVSTPRPSLNDGIPTRIYKNVRRSGETVANLARIGYWQTLRGVALAEARLARGTSAPGRSRSGGRRR